jgi:hypothetical protein
MKFEVKVGEEFEIEGEVVVTEFVYKQDVDSLKSGLFSDWKVTSVVAIFILVFFSGVYAAVTGDASLYEKFLDAVVKVASEPPKGNHGKESD